MINSLTIISIIFKHQVEKNQKPNTKYLCSPSSLRQIVKQKEPIMKPTSGGMDKSGIWFVLKWNKPN